MTSEVKRVCVSGLIVTARLDRHYYRRLQILYSGRGSGEVCSVVLPRTLYFSLHSL